MRPHLDTKQLAPLKPPLLILNQ